MLVFTPSVFHLSDFKHFLVIVPLFMRWGSVTENYLEEMRGGKQLWSGSQYYEHLAALQSLYTC